MANDASLRLLSETEFDLKALAGYPVGCPTLDLSTTWDASDHNLFIYRPPNQAVSKIHQVGPPGTNAPDVQVVTWKPDGQFLAVGWSDGTVRIMGLESNKAVHVLKLHDSSTAAITHIGWATSSITQKIQHGQSMLGEQLIDDLSLSQEHSVLNLPQELTFLEVETAFPKISPLPIASAGADDDASVFTLRTGIEFLFQAPKRSDHDQVNVMVIGTSDGALFLSIYDSFMIGSFPPPDISSLSSPHLVFHAAHPNVSTHALFMADDTSNPAEIHLVPMDLPFISSSPINLSLLASKLTTLQTLLRYLQQTQLHVQTEWKNARELPSRFLRSVQTDLSEMRKGPTTILAALYHTAVTGHAYGPLREWLVDSLAERGHKRWDKAVKSGLGSIRNLVHENLLPALERCSIILSRLRGFAQFYDTRDDIGFTTKEISRMLDIISCLTLVGHKILLNTMDELEHFGAFSEWLRFQIDRFASSTSATEELTEKEATMDTSRVLTYIQTYLTESPLDGFFDAVSAQDHADDWNCIEAGPDLLPLLDKQLQRAESGEKAMKALPHVGFLVEYASTWMGRIFSGIAEAKKRSVRFGMPMRLRIGGSITRMDARMAATGNSDGIVYVALASKDVANKETCRKLTFQKLAVYLFQASLSIVNGISSNQDLSWRCIDLGASTTLIDVKFLNEYTLVLLCTDTDKTKPLIYTLPIRSDATPYTPYTHDSTTPDSTVPMSDAAAGRAEYKLPGAYDAMRPVRMEVHDGQDVRGQIGARVCLLAGNRTTWRTFTF